MFINISLFGKRERCLVFKNNAKGVEEIDLDGLKLQDFPLNDLVNYSSVIQIDEEKKLFVKITRSKYGSNNGHKKEQREANKLKFILREIIAERLLFTIKSLKEYRCSKKIAKIGIKTPKVYGAGFFLSNMNTYNGIIIYEKMENLVSAQEVLLTSDSMELKTILLEKIQTDYRIMGNRKIHFRDWHMSNILFDPIKHEIYWIDINIDTISRF